MTLTFEGTVVVPAADPDDGRRTAAALSPYLGEDGRAIVVYVVEKAGGGIDKTSVAQSEEYATDVFAEATAVLEGASGTVETEVLYGEDVVEAIFDAAGDHGADAVAFVARDGNRISELLTGDLARRLVKEAAVPVVALPGQ